MAIVRRCCCSLCQGHGLQARQGLLRTEGGGGACALGCVHPRHPPTPLLSLLLVEAMLTHPLACSGASLHPPFVGVRRKVPPFL